MAKTKSVPDAGHTEEIKRNSQITDWLSACSGGWTTDPRYPFSGAFSIDILHYGLQVSL